MAAVSTGIRLATIDGSIVNVSSPAVTRAFNTDFPTGEWGGAGLSVDPGDPVAEHGTVGRMSQTQDLCYRVHRLHRGVGAVRVAPRRLACRGTHHPSGGRGDYPGARPGHRHRDLPAHRARPAKARAFHRLDGIYGHYPGADDWWAAYREFWLALDLLSQPAYRHRGHIPCLAIRPCHPAGGRPEVRLRRRLDSFWGDVWAADGHVAGAALGV